MQIYIFYHFSIAKTENYLLLSQTDLRLRQNEHKIY